MIINAVLTGTVDAISDALSADIDWGPYTPKAVAIIGAGDCALPVVARAPAWDALEFPEQARTVVVLASPPSVTAVRAVLGAAANARMRTMLLQHDRVRPLTLNDLVGQPLRDVDWARIRSRIAGKRVLITGGGGSIGAELARRVASLEPSRLTLVDCSEYNLFRIGLELRAAVPVMVVTAAAPTATVVAASIAIKSAAAAAPADTVVV